MHVFPFSNLVWDGAAAAFRSVRSSTKQLASSAIALVGVVFEFAQSFKLLEPSIVRASSAASCVARRAPYIELSFSAFSPFQCFHVFSHPRTIICSSARMIHWINGARKAIRRGVDVHLKTETHVAMLLYFSIERDVCTRKKSKREKAKQ